MLSLPAFQAPDGSGKKSRAKSEAISLLERFPSSPSAPAPRDGPFNGTKTAQ